MVSADVEQTARTLLSAHTQVQSRYLLTRHFDNQKHFSNDNNSELRVLYSCVVCKVGFNTATCHHNSLV